MPIPLVVGERIYVFTRQDEDEVMTALDSRSAKVHLANQLSGAVQDEPGHGAARTGAQVHADVRRQSDLHARDERHRHRLRCRRPANRSGRSRPPPVEPLYHTAMSPLVDGNW